ncbi:MAG TPA: acyloxyacyl hydrolase [Candidatus Sulfotelmatobacter sp.]|nr:acyloxyacyl hydrolase [Candidatus Sulfotelmatobacter sp.]
MRRIFIPPDVHHARPLSKVKLAQRFGILYVPILLLGVCLPSHAQLTTSLSTMENLSAGDKPEKPYQHSLECLLADVPFESATRIGKGYPLMLPAQTHSNNLQVESAGDCDIACTQADCSPALNSQQDTLNSQSSDVDDLKTSESIPNSTSKPAIDAAVQPHGRLDINSEIYRRNRLDFALDVGWHPVNIPFIYDFAVGDSYNMTPLKYTLVPIIASLRWQVTNVGWPWILRGNMDFTFSGSITPIPRGTETHYYAFMFGIRRNFVHRNWKAVPFFEQRGGAGMIDAKEPLGVLFSQGQNLTFTYSLGTGVRYSFNTKYSFSAGMNYMHISNGYLSEPKFTNYGINVYGPMFGFNMRLGKPHHALE